MLIAAELDESPLAMLERGAIPELKALRLHNGTVYRWNRPCYGISDGRPHLRIENRVLPAGPTIVDEVANAAFYFGLMCALADEHDDVREVIAFTDAKENFLAAARYGLKARLKWFGGATHGADELILRELLPKAQQGLLDHGLDASDVDRYFGVLRERVESKRTGAQWMLDSLGKMDGARPDERYRALTTAIHAHRKAGEPVHTWELATVSGVGDVRESYRNVGQIMTTDLFTVHPEDLIDLAASVMDWEHLRHVPVEDHNGRLVGLVTYRRLLRMVGRGAEKTSIAVREIMRTGSGHRAPRDVGPGRDRGHALGARELPARGRGRAARRDRHRVGLHGRRHEAPGRVVADGLKEPGRRLGAYPGDDRQTGGTLLLVVGGLHGNEPAGVTAIRRVLAELERRAPRMDGRFVGLTGNLAALARRVRYCDRDLNRAWTDDEIDCLRETEPQDTEDVERRELLAEIETQLVRAWERIVLLDLHSTSASGAPFTIMGTRCRTGASPSPCRSP